MPSDGGHHARSLLVVGIGGSNRETSRTDQLLEVALVHVAALGVRTVHFGGDYLAALPIYSVDEPMPDNASGLLRAVASADGLLIASPGYHGGVSGLLKNGLDHLEALHDDARPYLDGRAVGLVVTAAGAQAGGTTLVSLRSMIHALRGWPTPFGATINSAEPMYDDAGQLSARVQGALHLVAEQVVDFARWRAAYG